MYKFSGMYFILFYFLDDKINEFTVRGHTVSSRPSEHTRLIRLSYSSNKLEPQNHRL